MPEHLNGASVEQELVTLDAELSRLLTVEPSPEFAARVRTRIATEPVQSNQWVRVLAPALVAAALLFVVFVMRSTPGVPAPASTRPDIRLRSDARIVQPPPVPAGRADLVRPRPAAPLRRPSDRATESDIVIDPSLAAAIRRLASEQPALPDLPPEASLDPVVVEPLNVPEIGNSGAGPSR